MIGIVLTLISRDSILLELSIPKVFFLMLISFLFFLFFFLLFRAAPTAYGSSQARSQIGFAAAGLQHS